MQVQWCKFTKVFKNKSHLDCTIACEKEKQKIVKTTINKQSNNKKENNKCKSNSLFYS